MGIAPDDHSRVGSAALIAADGDGLRIGRQAETADVAAINITAHGPNQSVRRSHINTQDRRIADEGDNRAVRPDLQHVVPIGINSGQDLNGVRPAA